MLARDNDGIVVCWAPWTWEQSAHESNLTLGYRKGKRGWRGDFDVSNAVRAIASQLRVQGADSLQNWRAAQWCNMRGELQSWGNAARCVGSL